MIVTKIVESDNYDIYRYVYPIKLEFDESMDAKQIEFYNSIQSRIGYYKVEFKPEFLRGNEVFNDLYYSYSNNTLYANTTSDINSTTALILPHKERSISRIELGIFNYNVETDSIKIDCLQANYRKGEKVTIIGDKINYNDMKFDNFGDLADEIKFLSTYKDRDNLVVNETIITYRSKMTFCKCEIAFNIYSGDLQFEYNIPIDRHKVRLEFNSYINYFREQFTFIKFFSIDNHGNSIRTYNSHLTNNFMVINYKGLKYKISIKIRDAIIDFINDKNKFAEKYKSCITTSIKSARK